jgi:ethanolamine kinase
MGDSLKATLVASKLAQWHQLQLDSAASPTLFPTLWKWLRGVPPSYSSDKANRQFHQSIDMAHVEDELTHLELKVKALNSPVVFCHNDLLSGNIIFIDEAAARANCSNCPASPLDEFAAVCLVPAASARVEFIDYEYGNYNYRGFDIANHFCEYAGFQCDYSKFPSKKSQMEWFAVYLRQLKNAGSSANSSAKVKDPSSDLPDPSKEELEAMYREVSLFTLASHFFWGLWALIQAQYSDINFDYMAYAILRFKCYEEFKKEIPDALNG